jgi:hypothetical protein
MSDAASVELVPTSFGVFKPVGWLMVGLPTQASADSLAVALKGAGWASASVLHFTPRETLPELQVMVDNAGSMAGFGYEITLLRRYIALTLEGVRWLLVKVDAAQEAASAADLARANGARLAVHYRLLTVEELIGGDNVVASSKDALPAADPVLGRGIDRL